MLFSLLINLGFIDWVLSPFSRIFLKTKKKQGFPWFFLFLLFYYSSDLLRFSFCKILFVFTHCFAIHAENVFVCLCWCGFFRAILTRVRYAPSGKLGVTQHTVFSLSLFFERLKQYVSKGYSRFCFYGREFCYHRCPWKGILIMGIYCR